MDRKDKKNLVVAYEVLKLDKIIRLFQNGNFFADASFAVSNAENVSSFS